MFSIQPKMKRYNIITTKKDLISLCNKLMRLEEFAFDTETNSLKVLGKNSAFNLVGISISWGEYNNYYIPVGHRRIEDINNQLPLNTVSSYLKRSFEREDVRIIGWNLKYDMHVLARIGITIKTRDIFDGMIASWLCDENTPNGLKENSSALLGIDQTHFKEVTDTIPKEVKKEFGLKANNKAGIDLALIEDAAPYALADAFYTWELYLGFIDKLVDEKMDKIYKKVYIPFIYTLFEMEESGVTVDLEALENMRIDIKKDMDELVYKIYELAGCEFNCSSGQQLATLLFGYEKDNTPKELIDNSFRFKVISTTNTGIPQTNSAALWTISKMEFKNVRKKEGVELCKNLMEYKKLEKLSSAFIEGLKEQLYDDGKAHPSFNIIGTDSGRLSCSSPNLQQLPKAEEEDKYQIRSLFIGSIDKVTGKRKKIVALDFANLEMRVLAHFSEDKNLLEMFEKGYDTHGSTAVNMFELDCEPSEVKKKYPHLRQAAKIINFMLMYGGGAFRLYEALKEDRFNSIDLGDESYLKLYHCKKGQDVAQVYIDKYFATYSGVADFIKNQKKFAKRNGYVYTLLQRKRRLPGIQGDDFKVVSYCERLAVNSAIQGSAADITMSAQNRINNDPWYKEHKVNMIIQVHDELVFECPEEYVDECIKKTQHYMSHSFGDNVSLNLPMLADADFGDSYQEAK